MYITSALHAQFHPVLKTVLHIPDIVEIFVVPEPEPCRCVAAPCGLEVMECLARVRVDQLQVCHGRIERRAQVYLSPLPRGLGGVGSCLLLPNLRSGGRAALQVGDMRGPGLVGATRPLLEMVDKRA